MLSACHTPVDDRAHSGHILGSMELEGDVILQCIRRGVVQDEVPVVLSLDVVNVLGPAGRAMLHHRVGPLHIVEVLRAHPLVKLAPAADDVQLQVDWCVAGRTCIFCRSVHARPYGHVGVKVEEIVPVQEATTASQGGVLGESEVLPSS